MSNTRGSHAAAAAEPPASQAHTVAPAHAARGGDIWDVRVVRNLLDYDTRYPAAFSADALACVQRAAVRVLAALTRDAAREQSAVGGPTLTRAAVTAAVLAHEEYECFAEFVPEADLALPLQDQYLKRMQTAAASDLTTDRREDTEGAKPEDTAAVAEPP